MAKILDLVQRIEQVMGQPIVAYGAVIALHIGVLLRLSRLDKRDLDAMFCSPRLGGLADVFRAVVAADHAGLAAPFDQLV